MSNVSAQSVKKNFALSTVYQILVLALPFITAPYVSRVLGAEGIGVYSFTGSVVGYFTLFAHLGTLSYGAREISRARNDRKRLSRLFWEIEALVVCTTTICLFFWGVWIIFAPEYNLIYLILSMNLIGTMADISWFFTGLEQFKYIVVRNSLVKIAGIVLLFVFIREKSDLTLYIFLMTIINLMGALSMWMYIHKMVDRVDWRSLCIKHHLKETLVYFVPAIATSVYTILNKVLLGFMSTDIRENGYYDQALKIVTIGQTLTFTALNSVLGARISYLFAEQKIDEIRQRISKSLHYILAMGLYLVTMLIAIAPCFVPWFFGPGFEPTVFLLQLLSPIILIIGVSNCLGSQYYTPAGLRKQSARYIIIGAIVNLFLNIILIPKYGAVGAVVGSLMAEFTITGLYLGNCNGFMTMKQILQCGWSKIIASILMFVAVSIIIKNVSNNTFSIFISFFGGTIIYVLTLLLMQDTFLLQIIKTILMKSLRKNSKIDITQ